MAYGEHIRYLKVRAQQLSDEADHERSANCISIARTLCDDSDHELVCNQAVEELQRGNAKASLKLFSHALAICEGRDRRLVEMLSRVYGRSRDASGAQQS
uniref:ER membrane protein complex subunit 2 n=1 Tax=Calcidiscus leptoporus TaxID=127549 RepID=A0A7S0NUW0_9EUKA